MPRCSTAHVPFAERGGTLRGILDLATGAYPPFAFGGPTGRYLPVFHLHEVGPDDLDRSLRYLAEHGYETVTSDAVLRLVRDGVHPGASKVVLCFDDARVSLWTVAAPLLRRYGFTAVTFAIPGRIEDAAALRPTLDVTAATSRADRAGLGVAAPKSDGVSIQRAGDAGSPGVSASPFATWPELIALHQSGVIDVQSHTYSHALVFCADECCGFITPSDARTDPLDLPLRAADPRPTFFGPDNLGAPLYPMRSRMSDGRRFIPDERTTNACEVLVNQRGGAAFFDARGWRAELQTLIQTPSGRWESDQERLRAIEDDLDQARAVLAERLRSTGVRHLCFPWGIAGSIARDAARRTGYDTAYSERLFGRRSVRAGDDRYRLMRLNGRFITRLPRRRRTTVTVSPAASIDRPDAH